MSEVSPTSSAGSLPTLAHLSRTEKQWAYLGNRIDELRHQFKEWNDEEAEDNALDGEDGEFAVCVWEPYEAYGENNQERCVEKSGGNCDEEFLKRRHCSVWCCWIVQELESFSWKQVWWRKIVLHYVVRWVYFEVDSEELRLPRKEGSYEPFLWHRTGLQPDLLFISNRSELVTA